MGDQAPMPDAEIDAGSLALAQAIIDVCWKATPYGEDDEGFITHYLLSCGPIHRLTAAAQAAGISAPLRNTPADAPRAAAPDGLREAVEGLAAEWMRPLAGARQRANIGEDFAAVSAEESLRRRHASQLCAILAAHPAPGGGA